MYYFASKLVMIFLHPFHWVVGGLVLSILVKSRGWKRVFRFGSLLIFLIFGNRGLINAVYTSIEPLPLSQDKITGPYPYGILLGGGFARINPSFPDRIFFGDHINRLTESMELYHSGKIKRLIISGGDGSLARKKEAEALNINTFLSENNWPDSALVIEPDSRNTFENARNVKQILDSLQVKEPVLLITSALHMSRARGCFVKQGIELKPYPADYLQRDGLGLADYLIPDLSCFSEWQAVIKEWVGTLVYRIKGYV
jgi:uncharacterized SAM-binding protein YcdF (DUF218 family)